MNLRRAARIFVSGLVVLLPVFVTIAILIWLVQSADAILGGEVRSVFRGTGMEFSDVRPYAEGALGTASFALSEPACGSCWAATRTTSARLRRRAPRPG